jgi:hypothetical protein
MCYAERRQNQEFRAVGKINEGRSGMWTEETRERFQQLRQSESSGELSESEAVELAVFRDELLAAEAEYLLPAAERLGEESAIIERQNQELEALLRRKTALAQRLERVLVEAQAEREAIEGELAAVLVSRGNAKTAG